MLLDIFSYFLIALGLSADSFAVSVSSGLILKRIDFFNAMKIAFFLAFFQTLFPFIGWLIGSQIKDYIVEFDHWIAFLLLAFIGFRMIYDNKKNSSESKKMNPLNIFVLIGLSVATSIDALIVGFSFAFINVAILLPLLMIGSVTFIVSMSGILFGKKTGVKFGNKMVTLGGIILILIGSKILIEHLFLQ